MSIEYTIDIQLTELGFPDIAQAEEPPGAREAASRSPTSLPGAHKRRLLSSEGDAAGASKRSPGVPQAALFSASPLSETLLRKSLATARGARGERAAGGSAAREEEEEEEDEEDRIGAGAAGGPLLAGEEEGGVQKDAAGDGAAKVQQDVEDDSDDSDVSDVYEEEEEEDYEEEEGPNNAESSHSGAYRCSVCDLQLASNFKLQDHMNLHTGARPYCCAECGKRFCQIYNYRVHLRTHARAKVDRLLCRVCLMGFASQEDLKHHLSSTHFEDEFYECDLCKRVFTSLKACEYHVQLHKCTLHAVCEVCGRTFATPKSLARHQRRTCYRSFKCTDCTKTFTKKNALLKHSFSHLGLLPYTCIRCRCHFRLAKLYRQHKCEPERIHCVACLREFLSQEDFQQHKRDTGCWGNQEPKGDEIRCLECGQRFDSPEELKKHAGAHQRVLKCADCGKGFRSALLLMSHMGGHAGKSPCLCQSCGLGFPHHQNYDSHLKTCGQTPPPVSAPKKRQAPKSSSPETPKQDAKPDSSSPANAVPVPAVVSNSPAAPVTDPVRDPVSPGPVSEGVPADSGADGLWKLTLDKEPPPGVNLVLFLPMCPTQPNGLPLPSAVPQTMRGPDTQVQPEAALPSASGNGHLGVNAALGVTRFTIGIQRDPECEAPLDLSKKSNSMSKSAPSNVPLLPVKNEPEHFDISGEANGTERVKSESSDRKATYKSNPGAAEPHTETNPLEMDPMDLSAVSTLSRLIMDIKREPQAPVSVSDAWSSKSSQLTDWRPEKEIKMEIDVSNPGCADEEK